MVRGEALDAQTQHVAPCLLGASASREVNAISVAPPQHYCAQQRESEAGERDVLTLDCVGEV